MFVVFITEYYANNITTNRLEIWDEYSNALMPYVVHKITTELGLSGITCYTIKVRFWLRTISIYFTDTSSTCKAANTLVFLNFSVKTIFKTYK